MPDVVVIGAGHNGLTCGCYLARAGMRVTVLESQPEPGGCIRTAEAPDGMGRFELGAYEHGGIRASGVSADLELETRHGLAFHLRDEVTLSPCDDGTAIAFHNSLDATAEGLAAALGADEAQRYRRLAGWASAAMGLVSITEAGPPPTLRELAALAESSLGAREGARLVQVLLQSASALLRGSLEDDRLRGAIAHWAAHSQQPPSDPGTSVGALAMTGGHGSPAARPVGGSRSTVDALVRALRHHGGELVTGSPVERIETAAGRVAAVHAGGVRYRADTVVSAIDARRVFLGMMDPADVPRTLLDQVGRIHSGTRNVSELKVDAILEGEPAVPGPPGFERAFMLSPNTLGDIERGFASIRLGRLPDRPTVMIAMPSRLEPGWAPPGGTAVWISTFVPWRPADGAWTPATLEAAADHTWAVVERALGTTLTATTRRLTGPDDWVGMTGNANANPNHVEMSLDQLLGNRPSPGLSGYRTPVPGLYLSGAGTHPGGGVTGMPGRNAARVVLQDAGVTRRPRAAALRARAALMRDAARAAWALRRAA
ncbi:MAG: NAD(P)/FAD-dependent oxidoreductase [Thermoleophilia bacterium]|nr:NAD(P)/FAD-dependent oxidoreductase [Thermoleophilia bacterium]